MPFKAGIALAILIVGGGLIKWAYDAVWDSGYNAAVVEQDAEIRKAEQAAVAKARQEWENVAALAEREIVVEERIVEKIREVEREIPIVVESIVEIQPDCADLGDDFARLLNEQARSGADRSNDRSDPAAVPD